MNSGWTALPLGDGILAEGAKGRIEAAFERAFHGNAPPGAAVFLRTDEGRGLHCEVIAFFSPAAGPVGAALGARPSRAPRPAGLDCLCGSPGRACPPG